MVVDSRLLLLFFLVLNIEQKLQFYINKKRAAEAATEATQLKIRNQNQAAADAMGVTLTKWHEIMTGIGESGQNTPAQIVNTEVKPVQYTSADYVLSYLFPQDTVRKMNKRKK